MKKAKNMVAFVGTYTTEGETGLYIYDVNKDGEFLRLKDEIKADNPSYIIMSKDEEVLYSIVDDGVASFKIDSDGSLLYMNTKPIDGMRGCFLDIDSKRRFVFVAGYHDGRVSMVKLKKDGCLSGLADGVFHRGHAISANERRLDHPKVSCVRLTPDEQFLCATDYGLNQMRVYRIDYDKGRIIEEEIVRCAMDSGPRTIVFSKDGRFCYILTEGTNSIEVYKYNYSDDKVCFDLVERVPVLENMYVAGAATHMFMTDDGEFLFVSIDGMNYVSWLKVNKKDGTLKMHGTGPVSGDYPKFICMLPDSDNLVICNHDSNEIREYKVNFEKDYMLLCNKPAKVKRVNCICFRKVD